MDALVFSLSGQPFGKQRPRATVRGGIARIYTPEKTVAYEKAIGRIAAAAMAGRKPFEGPLSVSMRFRFEPPKSTTKTRRARLLAGEEAYIGVFDLDNLAKACADAMNGVVFVDDKQIVRLWLTKIAAEKPGIDVRIEPLAPQSPAQLPNQPAQQEGAR